MRQPAGKIEPPPAQQVDLAERLRATAERLAQLPEDVVVSLSLTIGWQSRDEAEVRTLAHAAAGAARVIASVQADGDVVTVRFWRMGRARPHAD